MMAKDERSFFEPLHPRAWITVRVHLGAIEKIDEVANVAACCEAEVSARKVEWASKS
jgi:hypothetical protein